MTVAWMTAPIGGKMPKKNRSARKLLANVRALGSSVPTPLPKSRSRAPEQGRKPVVHGIPDEYEDRYVRATSALGERSEGLRVVSRVRPAHQYPKGGQQHRPKQLAEEEGRVATLLSHLFEARREESAQVGGQQAHSRSARPVSARKTSSSVTGTTS